MGRTVGRFVVGEPLGDDVVERLVEEDVGLGMGRLVGRAVNVVGLARPLTGTGVGPLGEDDIVTVTTSPPTINSSKTTATAARPSKHRISLRIGSRGSTVTSSTSTACASASTLMRSRGLVSTSFIGSFCSAPSVSACSMELPLAVRRRFAQVMRFEHAAQRVTKSVSDVSRVNQCVKSNGVNLMM